MTSEDVPQNPLRRYSDAAYRISDTIGMHLAADFDGNWNKWCAFTMREGTSDGVVYPTPEDAARHQLAPEYCVYIKMVDAMSPKEAETYLSAHRQAYDAGYRSDPETPVTVGTGGGARILMPLEVEKWNTSGLILPTHLRSTRRTRR